MERNKSIKKAVANATAKNFNGAGKRSRTAL